MRRSSVCGRRTRPSPPSATPSSSSATDGSPTREAVYDRLDRVDDPELDSSVVKLGYIERVEITGERVEQDAMFVEISNTRYTGSSFLIAPKALPDDGLLDVTLLRKLSRIRLLTLLPTIYRGAHTRFHEVYSFQAREIKVIGPERLELLADGEVYGESPFTVTCLQKDVEMFSAAKMER